MDDPAPDCQRLFPPVLHLHAMGIGHGIFGWTEFAQENAIAVRIARTPAFQPVAPPPLKQIHPFCMLWKIELKLDLLAAGNAPLKAVGPFDGAPDQTSIARIQGPLEFAINDKVRQIGT